MKKKISLGARAREELFCGAEKLASLARTTMGPGGHNIITASQTGAYEIASSGGGISGDSVFADVTENAGAILLRRAGEAVRESCGDGYASAAVIAERAGGPIWLQVVLFFAVSFVLLYFTRPWAMKFVKPKNVKTNYEEVEGKTVRVTRRVDNIAGTGTVVYNGMEWSARTAEDGSVFEEGELAEVTEVQGVKLILKKVEKSSMR